MTQRVKTLHVGPWMQALINNSTLGGVMRGCVGRVHVGGLKWAGFACCYPAFA